MLAARLEIHDLFPSKMVPRHAVGNADEPLALVEVSGGCVIVVRLQEHIMYARVPNTAKGLAQENSADAAPLKRGDDMQVSDPRVSIHRGIIPELASLVPEEETRVLSVEGRDQ